MIPVKGLALAVVLASPIVVHADDTTPTQTMDKKWPALPDSHALSEEDVMVDHLSDIGNLIGGNLDVLSHDMLVLKVDGRGQRAKLRVGSEHIGTSQHFLTFCIDTDWLFTNGQAHVTGKVDLGIGKHQLELKLPEMDLSHDSYRGTDLVQVNVPLLQRTF